VQFVSYGIRFGKAIICTKNDSQFVPLEEFKTDDKESNAAKKRMA